MWPFISSLLTNIVAGHLLIWVSTWLKSSDHLIWAKDHPLSAGISPFSVDDGSYLGCVSDSSARVAIVNYCGCPVLLSKQIGTGSLIYLSDVFSEYQYSDLVLTQIVKNALIFKPQGEWNFASTSKSYSSLSLSSSSFCLCITRCEAI